MKKLLAGMAVIALLAGCLLSNNVSKELSPVAGDRNGGVIAGDRWGGLII